MKNRDAKWEFLMNRDSQNCRIWVVECRGGKHRVDVVMGFPTELHHARCHDTKLNRERFPLFIDSILNVVQVCSWNHARHRSWGIWSPERCGRAEAFLKRHPRIARWVNDPRGPLWK